MTAPAVHLWTADLRSGGVAGWLSADETERAARFATAELTRRYVAARSALRAVLAHHTGQDPHRVTFSSGPDGKPALADGPYFSHSHSVDLQLIAVCAEVEVGVDVEVAGGGQDLTAIEARWFSGPERLALSRLAPARRTEARWRMWTAKEAYAKGVGVGLRLPLDRFSVPAATAGGTGPLALTGDVPSPDEAARWRLWPLTLHAGGVGTLAVRAAGARVVGPVPVVAPEQVSGC